MGRSKSTEWVVPRDYGVPVVSGSGSTLDVPILDITNAFNAYGTDEVTLLALKGHIVINRATSAIPEPMGWRVRMGLQDLTTLAITTVGDLDLPATAEEHFLSERWFVIGSLDDTGIFVQPYFLKVDISNKRIVRRGQALVFSIHYQAPGGNLTVTTYLRALVLL